MNRLHKKCVVASTGLHLLLILILFVGPGFLSPSKTAPDFELLTFVPFETVDAMVSGGGDPNAAPPPAAPNVRPQLVQPTPVPPEPERRPEPEVKPRPEPKPEKVAPEPAPKARKQPQISLSPVVRNNTKAKAAKEAADRQARAEAENLKNLASKLGSMANAIPGSISSSTKVGLIGPGGGGVPYANFLQAVKTVYTRAWQLPEGITDDEATVETTVTIARDGTVVDWKITRRSGNALVDDSVRATLQRVKYAAPLPKAAKEDQRTVAIDFNVKAKKLLG